MKFFIRIIIILSLIFSFGCKQTIKESPIKGFNYENLKGKEVKLTWHNALKPQAYTLVVGANKKIGWIPKDGTEYNMGEIIDKTIHIIGKTEDKEYTTVLSSKNRYKYYEAFGFDSKLNYSQGREASEKTILSYQITYVGLAVVFLGLILLVFTIKILGLLIEHTQKKHAEIKERWQKKAEEEPQPTQIASHDTTVPSHIIVAISAAISAYMGSTKYSIKSIKRKDEDPWIKLSRLDGMTQQ